MHFAKHTTDGDLSHSWQWQSMAMRRIFDMMLWQMAAFLYLRWALLNKGLNKGRFADAFPKKVFQDQWSPSICGEHKILVLTKLSVGLHRFCLLVLPSNWLCSWCDKMHEGGRERERERAEYQGQQGWWWDILHLCAPLTPTPPCLVVTGYSHTWAKCDFCGTVMITGYWFVWMVEVVGMIGMV